MRSPFFFGRFFQSDFSHARMRVLMRTIPSAMHIFTRPGSTQPALAPICRSRSKNLLPATGWVIHDRHLRVYGLAYSQRGLMRSSGERGGVHPPLLLTLKTANERVAHSSWLLHTPRVCAVLISVKAAGPKTQPDACAYSPAPLGNMHAYTNTHTLAFIIIIIVVVVVCVCAPWVLDHAQEAPYLILLFYPLHNSATLACSNPYGKRWLAG